MDLAGLRASDWRVRREAVESVSGLEDLHSAELAERLVELVRASSGELSALNSALDVLGRLDDSIVPRLAPLVDHPLSEARQAVALVLARFRGEASTQVLLRLLEDPNDNVRYHAVEALGLQGARTAVPTLMDLAQGDDFFLGFAAAEALGRIGDRAATMVLIRLLADEFRATAAVEALGRLGHRLAVPPLAEGLESGAHDFQEASLSLDRIAGRYARDLGSEELVERLAVPRLGPSAAQRAQDEVGRAGSLPEDVAAALPRILSWALRAVPDRTPLVQALRRLMDLAAARSGAGQALRTAGPQARQALEDLLDHREPSVRRLAAEALGDLGDLEAVPALVAALDHRDATTAAAAARGLGRLGDPAALEPILNRLHHPNALVRHELVCAGQALGPVPQERLLAMLEDPDPMRRSSAAQWLGASDEPRVVARLEACLGDPDVQVRRAGIESMARWLRRDPDITRALTDALRDGTPDVRAAAARVLEAGPLEVGPPLLQAALEDGNLWTRIYACRSLARLAGPDAVEGLKRLAADPAPPVRAVAAEALGRAGREAVLEPLVALLQDPEPDVVLGAVTGLAHSGNPAAASALRRVAEEHPQVRARRAAVAALGGLPGPEAVAALRRAASDPATCEAALEALAMSPEPEALEALVGMLASEGDTESQARSLERAGARAVDPLSRWLHEPGHPSKSLQAVEVLGLIPGEAAEGRLVRAAVHPDAHIRTAALLSLCDRPSAAGREAASRTAGEDPDPAVRELAKAVERVLDEDLAG